MIQSFFKASGSRKTTALTREQFDFVIQEFRNRGDLRMEIICLLMGRCIRIGDVLLTIRIRDIFSAQGEIKETITFREQKTKKPRIIKTGSSLRLKASLSKYYLAIKGLPPDSPLFYGEKTGRPLQDKGVKYLLAEFVGKEGIDQCSPHSFRKYGAKYLWTQGVEIETISEILNHGSVKETRVYLDIKPREVERAMLMLEI